MKIDSSIVIDINRYVAVIYHVIFLLIFCVNLTSIVVVLTSKFLHTIPGGLMINLSISDLIFGVTLIIGSDIMLTKNKITHNECLLASICTQVSGAISLWTILLINLDRYFAILLPLKYDSLVTKRKLILILFLIWMIQISINLASFNSNVKSNFHELTYICNIDISTNKELWIIVVIITYGVSSLALIVIYTHLGYISYKKCISNQNKKYIKTASLLVASFYICWSPMAVRLLILSSGGTTANLQPLEVSILLLMYLNSFLNTIIYAATNKRYKESLFKLFGRRNKIADINSAVS